ncbi:MAG: cyclic 2,3-diphosphoglycerate synthase [Nitrospinota bacterium]
MRAPLGVIIMGAAGRDFHNFNVRYRGDPSRRVAAFTAAQIPRIEGRRYPPELAGPLYPEGIPIHPEAELERLIRANGVTEVAFSYSDVSHLEVMHRASRALAAGASFILLGPRETQLRSRKPVAAVTAVRTGCGKSPVSRFLLARLREMGLAVAAVRHPMPYGDLLRQRLQRFSSHAGLDAAQCTVEEREEYAPYIEGGGTVFAGVDYQAVLDAAEREADVILWDGGNNDFPFFAPDLHITLADPFRLGHERTYHPGEANLLMADIVILAKTDTAPPEAVEALRRSVQEANPRARVLEGAMPLELARAEELRGRPVLVVEDGPTVTHGEMPHGAGFLAARAAGARVVDPRPFARGSLREAYQRHPWLGPVLPALGYAPEQLRELEETLAAAACGAVVLGTPVDLGRLIRIPHPVHRVRYAYADRSQPGLGEAIRNWWEGARGR